MPVAPKPAPAPVGISPAIWGTIRTAALQQKTVILSYRDSKGEVTQREVEPYEEKNGSLWAFCNSRGGIRNFKLEGILDARITEKTYVPQWEVKIQ